jgi:hypothetical protein
MPPPVKPFPEYRWRWFSNEPTENLLLPPVFLGVLRVMAVHEGRAPSDLDVIRDLARVGEETGSPVNLARTENRNLIRNSGQYWKATGLLSPERGVIHLTPLGRLVAQGRVTRSEFAAIMVQQTILPNPWIDPPVLIQTWHDAGLEIKPLQLIIQVMEELGRSYGGIEAAYITPWELIKICIPLAGNRATSAAIARHIARHRSDRLNVDAWPDCAPGANDKRLAKEFLRFLANFGICQRIPGRPSDYDRYQLKELDDPAVLGVPRETIFNANANTDVIVETVRQSQLPSLIERQRIMVSVLARPGQSRFRDDLIRVCNGRCILTGDSIPYVLEAAHIKPVEYSGPDVVGNGVLLRVDIHRLFDSGNIRLRPTGELVLTDAVQASENYRRLPARINIPRFMDRQYIEWRDQYL